MPLITFILILGVFWLFYLLPPSVKVYAFVGKNPAAKQGNAIEQLIQLHHLDQGYFVQLGEWFGQLLHGNLGWSTSQTIPVMQALTSYLPATLELVLYSLLPLLLGGIWLGVQSAVKKNRLTDHVTRTMSILAFSLPGFALGLLLLLIFYAGFGLFGSGRLGNTSILIVQNPSLWHSCSGLYTLDALLNGRLDVFWDALMHLVLPVITLSFGTWAILVRITRASVLSALGEDYILTARAKGQKEGFVVRKHALRNALIPVITLASLLVGSVLSGVVIIETVFGIHGIGLFFLQAAVSLDIAAVLGYTIFAAALWVLINLVTDLLYALVDPKVRLD